MTEILTAINPTKNNITLTLKFIARKSFKNRLIFQIFIDTLSNVKYNKMVKLFNMHFRRGATLRIPSFFIGSCIVTTAFFILDQ